MTLDEYFKRSDTPGANSPVGVLMRRIIDEGTTTDYDKARELANLQLQKAAGKKHFRPQTPKEELERRQKTADYFRGTRET
jgi:hypothetical protein